MSLPKEDYQAMLDHCLEVADKMLSEEGYFVPFGALILQSGQFTSVSVDVGEDRAEVEEFIEILADTFRTRADKGDLRACCICIDGTQTDENSGTTTDALICDAEHRNWEPMRLARPYWKADDGQMIWGNVIATELAARVFIAPKTLSH